MILLARRATVGRHRVVHLRPPGGGRDSPEGRRYFAGGGAQRNPRMARPVILLARRATVLPPATDHLRQAPVRPTRLGPPRSSADPPPPSGRQGRGAGVSGGSAALHPRPNTFALRARTGHRTFSTVSASRSIRGSRCASPPATVIRPPTSPLTSRRRCVPCKPLSSTDVRRRLFEEGCAS